MAEIQTFLTGDNRTVTIDVAGGEGLGQQDVMDLAEFHAKDAQGMAAGGMDNYTFPIRIPAAFQKAFFDALTEKSGGTVAAGEVEPGLLRVTVSGSKRASQ